MDLKVNIELEQLAKSPSLVSFNELVSRMLNVSGYGSWELCLADKINFLLTP